MNFKKNLKELRVKRGFTQQEFAKKLGMDINSYRYMEQETKKAKTISFDLLEQLTEILECDYNELLK